MDTDINALSAAMDDYLNQSGSRSCSPEHMTLPEILTVLRPILARHIDWDAFMLAFRLDRNFYESIGIDFDYAFSPFVEGFAEKVNRRLEKRRGAPMGEVIELQGDGHEQGHVCDIIVDENDGSIEIRFKVDRIGCAISLAENLVEELKRMEAAGEA